ncbi:MAG TPA: hypothetical protein VJX67_11340, partial [Blastocatellia bacterium]|nr:hypothetical protein [Blastocatellia bacterium]
AQVHFSLAHAYARKGRKEDAARERAAFLKLDAERQAASLHGGSESVGAGVVAPSSASEKPQDKPREE